MSGDKSDSKGKDDKAGGKANKGDEKKAPAVEEAPKLTRRQQCLKGKESRPGKNGGLGMFAFDSLAGHRTLCEPVR